MPSLLSVATNDVVARVARSRRRAPTARAPARAAHAGAVPLRPKGRTPCASTTRLGARSPRSWASSPARACRSSSSGRYWTDDPYSSWRCPRRVAPSRAPRVARAPRRCWLVAGGALTGIGGALVLAVGSLAVAVLAVTGGMKLVSPASFPSRRTRWAQIKPGDEQCRGRGAGRCPPRLNVCVLSRARCGWRIWTTTAFSRIDPRSRREAKSDYPRLIAPIVPRRRLRRPVWAIGGDGFVRRIDPIFNSRAPPPSGSQPSRPADSAARGLAGAASGHGAVWRLAVRRDEPPRVADRPGDDRSREECKRGRAPPRSWSRSMRSGSPTTSITRSRGSIRRRGRRNDSGRARAEAIAVGAGASGSPTPVDDTVVRIDPATNAVKATIEVGRATGRDRGRRRRGVGRAAATGRSRGSTRGRTRWSRRSGSEAAPSAWPSSAGGVGDDPGRPPARAATAGCEGGGVRAQRRGVRLHRPGARTRTSWQLEYATCAKLLNYPDRPAPAGSRLVPEVARVAAARVGRRATLHIQDPATATGSRPLERAGHGADVQVLDRAQPEPEA